MPGHGWLDKILTDVRETLPTAPTPDDQTKIRDGILNMFEPVMDVFEKLRTVVADTPMQPYVATRECMRETLRGMTAPQLPVPLDTSTVMVVRIATRTGMTYPDIITTAKWRCILTANGQEVDNQLYDSRESMARWIVQQVLRFASRTAAPMPIWPPGTPEPLTRDSPRPAIREREQRVIMMDDDPVPPEED